MRLPIPALPDPRDLVGVLPRVLGLLDEVSALLQRIEQTRADADVVIADVATTVGRADALITDLEVPTRRLLPLLERIAETTDEHEVEALVELIDHLPELAGRVETNVVPILETLSTVAPDLHDLLDVSKELNSMMAKMPGMGRMKRRVDKQQERDGRG